MILTVFQNLPIIEKEILVGVELNKKAQSDETANDNYGSDEDCDGDDPEPGFDLYFSFFYTSFHLDNKSAFSPGTPKYSHQLGNIHTPPPKF
jgi:hypothetical protein